MHHFENDNEWVIELEGGKVSYIHIDFRLKLDFLENSKLLWLVVETPFRLKSPSKDLLIDPEKTQDTCPVLDLFNAKVAKITVQKMGKVRVEFAGERVIEVSPDDKYEAWQMGSPFGLMVCTPGGGVSLYSGK